MIGRALRVGRNIFGLPILEQVLYAGSSFGLQLFVARQSSPEGFGAYTVATGLFFLAALIHQTVLVEPVFVYAEGKFKDCSAAYQWHVFSRWTFNFGGACSLAFCIAGAIFWTRDSREVALCMFAYAFSAPPMLHLWLFRRFMLRCQRPGLAVIAITLYVGFLLAVIIYLYLVNSVSAAIIILASGIASLIVAVVTWPVAKRVLAPLCSPHPSRIWSAHLQYGRWSFASELVNWTIANVPIYLLSAYSGLQSAALLRVIALVFMPLQQVVGVVMIIFLRDLARDASARRTVIPRRLFAARLLFLLITCAYVALACSLSPLFGSWLGHAYSVEASTLFAGGIGVVFMVASQLTFAVLRIQSNPRAVFLLHLVALSVGAAMWLILFPNEIVGLLVAQAGGWAISFLLGLLFVNRIQSSNRSHL